LLLHFPLFFAALLTPPPLITHLIFYSTFEKLSEKWLFHSGTSDHDINDAHVLGEEKHQESVVSRKYRKKSTFNLNLPKNDQQALAASAESIEMTSIDVVTTTDKDANTATTTAPASDESAPASDESIEIVTDSIANTATTTTAPAKKTKDRRKTTSRLMHFVKAETAHVGSLTRFSPKTLSRMSGLIMFFQCFMIGLLLLVS
jgi:hypothetical protein